MVYSTYVRSPTPNSSAAYENPWKATPLFLSLQLRQELYSCDTFIPAAGLSIPLFRLDYPKSHLTILGLNLLASAMIKLSLIYSGHYNSLAYLFNQACFDEKILLEMFPQIKFSSIFDPSPGNSNSSVINTPYLPYNFTIAFSLSSPCQIAEARVSTIFLTELLQIEHVPRFIVPLISLSIYLYHVLKNVGALLDSLVDN